MMTEDKVTSITVEENGSKVNEPGATPQVQVDNKEEANDAIPTVEEVSAKKRQVIASMVSEEDKVSYVVPFSKVLAEGYSQGNTVFICGQWIVDGEVTFLSGDTNTCKSTVAHGLARAISDGSNFLGYPTKVCEVLYAETEMTSKQLYNRFKDVNVNDNFKYLDSVGKDLTWILEQVESYCKARECDKRLVVNR